MKSAKHSYVFFTVCGITAFLLYILDTVKIMTFSIGTAHPVVLIPLLVAVTMAAREWAGFIFGASFGILLDIVGNGSHFFNIIILSVIGLGCGLVCSYLVNENIYSAILLSLGASFLYFTAKWLFFYSSGGINNALAFYLTYSIPSAAYTTLFIIPCYYGIRLLSDKTAV